MISAFYSQEFSFGLNLSNKQCNQINEVWKGQQYVDIRAAIEMKKNAQQLKLDLTEFPFIKKIENGASNNGYWAYQHMVLQLEDCVNMLKLVLFPHYTHLFLCLITPVFVTRREKTGWMLRTWTGIIVEHSINAQNKNQGRRWLPWMFPLDLESWRYTINIFKPTDDGPFLMTEKECHGKGV